jgi:hypothetical protein
LIASRLRRLNAATHDAFISSGNDVIR